MVEAAEYVYVDTAFGGLDRRNHVRRLNEVNFKDVGEERYISHRRATVDLLEWTRTHHNDHGNPTIQGFDGAIWDPSLPFDFDDRHDPAHALVWLREFLDRLEHYEVPLDALRIYFSGAKGFHLEIPHTLFGGFEPSAHLHEWEKAAALELMGGIPFDTAVYDKLRLWRLPNTLNAKGQRYKVQLSLAEVRDLSMVEINLLAAGPRPRLPTAPDEEWMPNEYLVEVWQRAQHPELAQKQPRSDVEPATRQSDERRTRALTVAVTGLIASHWPIEDGISRHSDYLLPLSGFLSQHLDADQVAALLKDAALQAGDQNFLEDRTRHWQDEIDRLAMNSATKIAGNQPVEGLPTVARHWPELADMLSTLFVVRIRPPSTKSTGNGVVVTGFTFTSIIDMLAEPPEHTPFIVDGMLPAAGLSLWGAKPKVGKSVGVRNLAVSVARGELFLERMCQQGTVLVLALEEKRAEVINHFRDMGCSEELIHIHTGAAPQTSRDGIAAMAAAVAVYQPSLVIVDPVFKLVRVKDSSDYAELTRELEPVIELARNTGIHIAVTHHLGKMVRDGGDDVLGSTAIFGAVDTLVILRRKSETRIMHTVQRYGKDMPETTIPLDEFTGRIGLGSAISEIKKQEARQAVMELLKDADGLSQDDVRKQAGVQSASAYMALMELYKEGNVLRSGAGRAGDPYLYRAASKSGDSGCSLVLTTSIEEQENNLDKPKTGLFGGLCRTCQKRPLMYHETSGECTVCINARLPE